MFPMRTIELPLYFTTYPDDYEKIYLVVKNIFGKDCYITTNISEIRNMWDIIDSQSKIDQLRKYIDLDELISSYPDSEIRPAFIIENKIILVKYRINVLMYLVYKHILYNEELIRIIY